MSFHTETHSITVTGAPAGTGSTVTNFKLRGFLWQIIITPPDPDPATGTTWDMEIREEDSNTEILGWDTIQGAANSAFGLEVPMQAKKYKLNILGSDGDGTFTFRITVKEPVYV